MIHVKVLGKLVECRMRCLLFLTTLLISISSSAAARQALASRTIDVMVSTAAGVPVPSATVTLTYTGTGGDSTKVAMESDAGGHAVFRNLAPGFYGVLAERPGYFNAHAGTWGIRFGEPSGSLSENRQVRVVLVKGGTISGRIQDAGGRPIIDATVTPMRRVYQNGEWSWARADGVSGTKTNDLGDYRLFWLRPGEYRLQIDRPYTAAMQSPGLSFYFAPAYYPGTVDSKSATPVSMIEGQDIVRMDVKIPDAKGVTVSGKIVSLLPALNNPNVAADGIPLRSIYAGQLIPFGTGLAEDPPRLLMGSVTNSIDRESSFEIHGVPPGEYDFFPLLNDRSSGKAEAYTGRTRIVVSETNVTGVIATVGAGATIRGVLTSVDGKPALQDATPLSLIPVESLPAYGPFRQPRTLVGDGKKEFTISNVVEGRYRLAPFMSLENDDYVEDVRVNGGSVSREGIINVSGDSIDLELIIGRNGGTIEGTIEVPPPGGMPVAVTVVLIPDMPRRGNTSLYQTYSFTVTPLLPNTQAPDGYATFSFFAVAPGNYKVFAWEDYPRGDAAWSHEFMAQYEGRGVPVVVTQKGNVESVRVPIIRAP